MNEYETRTQGVTPPYNQGPPPPTYQKNKLYRSTRDKWIAGVCGGLAERYDHDPKLIRILWIVFTIIAFPAGIIAYILLWIFIEKYPSYFTPPPPTPQEGVESVHYHYYYGAKKQNAVEE
jgi:phage shock protein C